MSKLFLLGGLGVVVLFGSIVGSIFFLSDMRRQANPAVEPQFKSPSTNNIKGAEKPAAKDGAIP